MSHMRPASFSVGTGDGSILQQRLRSGDESILQPGTLQQDQYIMAQHHTSLPHPYNSTMIPQFNAAAYAGQSQPNTSPYSTASPYYSNSQARSANPFQPSSAMYDDQTMTKSQYLGDNAAHIASTSQQQPSTSTTSAEMPQPLKSSSIRSTPVPMEPPKAPQKPLIPYLRFSKSVWETVRIDNPGATFADIGKIIGKQWRECPCDIKKKYADDYATDKEKYAQAQKVHLESPEYVAWLKNKNRIDEEESIQAEQPTKPAADSGRNLGNPLVGSHSGHGSAAPIMASSSHHGPLEELQSMSQRIMTGSKTTVGSHLTSLPAEPDDDSDDHLRSKHVSSTRYRRNHTLMAEIFSDGIVPDGRMIVNEQRVQLLRKNVQSLTHHQEKLLSDQKELLEKHEIKKRKLIADNQAFAEKWMKVKEECKPVSKDQYQAMVDKYYAMYEEHVANYKAQQNAALANAQIQQQGIPPIHHSNAAIMTETSPTVDAEFTDAEMPPVVTDLKETVSENMTDDAKAVDNIPEEEMDSRSELPISNRPTEVTAAAEMSETAEVEVNEASFDVSADVSMRSEDSVEEELNLQTEYKVVNAGSLASVVTYTVEVSVEPLSTPVSSQQSSDKEDLPLTEEGQGFSAETTDPQSDSVAQMDAQMSVEEALTAPAERDDLHGQDRGSSDRVENTSDTGVENDALPVETFTAQEKSGEELKAEDDDDNENAITQNDGTKTDVSTEDGSSQSVDSVEKEEDDRVAEESEIPYDEDQLKVTTTSEMIEESTTVSAGLVDGNERKSEEPNIVHTEKETSPSDVVPDLPPEVVRSQSGSPVADEREKMEEPATAEMTNSLEEPAVHMDDSGGQGYADFAL